MCKRGILRAANPTVGGIVLSLVLGLPASATSLCDSPIEMIVGRVDDVQPSAAGAHLYRGGGEILIQEGMCLVYGDQITAKPGVIVQIDTTQRTTSIGGRDDPEWKAPVAKTAGGSGGSGVFAGFWDLLRVLQRISGAATESRGQECPQARGSSSGLERIPSLGGEIQHIGTDVEEIMVGWKPAGPVRGASPHRVSARLFDQNDIDITPEVFACTGKWITLHIKAKTLHAGMQLTLGLYNNGFDKDPAAITYTLKVVDPHELPPTPAMPRKWMVGAYRIMPSNLTPEQHADTALDSIARLSSAQHDAYVVQLILGGVFTGWP